MVYVSATVNIEKLAEKDTRQHKHIRRDTRHVTPTAGPRWHPTSDLARQRSHVHERSGSRIVPHGVPRPGRAGAGRRERNLLRKEIIGRAGLDRNCEIGTFQPKAVNGGANVSKNEKKRLPLTRRI